MARRKSKRKVTARHYAIALAVFFAVLFVGMGMVFTGNYTAKKSEHIGIDIAAVSATFPETLGNTFFVGSITLANYGTLSASSVKYNILVTQAASGGLVWQYDARANLAADETKVFELPAFDVTPGTYHIKLIADSAYDFNEADESNNVYESDFAVSR